MKKGMSVIQERKHPADKEDVVCSVEEKGRKIVNLDRVVGEALGRRWLSSKDLKEMKESAMQILGKNILGK